MSRDFKFPDLGEGIAEGELVKWLVHEGDTVKEDQDVAEVETDKALVPIPSPFAGKVEKLHFKEGDKVKVGAVLMTFSDGDKATPPSTPTPTVQTTLPALPSSPPAPSLKQEKLPPLATPYVRKMARERGIDLSTVSGSGAQGRITESDLQNLSTTPKAELKAIPTVSPTPAASFSGEDFSKFGEVENLPLKGIRRKISEHMLEAARKTVTVTHIDEAEVDALLKIRDEKMKYAQERGVKLTLLPFLMKACVIALKNHPYLNASLMDDQIVLKKYYHFGFAVDTEAGLIVPVIRDVDQKSIMRLASDLKELSEQARNRSLSVESLKGHSFSITNIGSIGGKAFTPIIHYPDSAILGLGRTYAKPVVRDGKIEIANMMPLCLSFDHRVADGATAARFVNEVIRHLKDPDLLLLEDGDS